MKLRIIIDAEFVEPGPVTLQRRHREHLDATHVTLEAALEDVLMDRFDATDATCDIEPIA